MTQNIDDRFVAIAKIHWPKEPSCVERGFDGIAVFSPDNLRRYVLTRTWDLISPSKIACWIMCNPSTADAFVLDPTIRRCVAFSKREGCTGLIVVNVYPTRSTDPKVLHTAATGAGATNEMFVTHAVQLSDIAIAAWGSFRASRSKSSDESPAVTAHGRIVALVEAMRRDLYALRLTANGDPGHPLYVPANAPLIPLTPTTYFTTGRT